MKTIKFLTAAILISISLSLYSQDTITGYWKGDIQILGSTLSINVKFFKGSGDSLQGKIDIPQQNAMGLQLMNISSLSGKVHFELPSGSTMIIFDGTQNGDSVKGDFTQAGFKGTFTLGRAVEDTTLTEQNEEPVPYKTEEVTFTNGENKFAGTLTIPEGQGKHPAVVMIAGSGAQNRNEDILGFKLFKIIADRLTRNGIEVLRFDKRGVGGSTGKSISESTTEDFAGDVHEAMNFLKTRDDINPDQIGLCGHSEGGIIAPLVQYKYGGAAFMVLIAGTGVKGIDILKEQSKLIMKADKSTDEEIEGYEKMLNMVYDANQYGTGWEEIRKKFRESAEDNYKNMSDQQKNGIKDKDAYINSMTDLTMGEFKSTWMKYFMEYDPSYALTKVTCPLLMFFGGKDMQVPVKQNRKPMEDALKKAGNKDVTVKVFPDANHLFQKAITGSPSEYGSLPKEFVDGFLDTITGWVLQRVTVVK